MSTDGRGPSQLWRIFDLLVALLQARDAASMDSLEGRPSIEGRPSMERRPSTEKRLTTTCPLLHCTSVAFDGCLDAADNCELCFDSCEGTSNAGQRYWTIGVAETFVGCRGGRNGKAIILRWYLTRLRKCHRRSHNAWPCTWNSGYTGYYRY